MDNNLFAALFGGPRPGGGGYVSQYQTVYDAMTNKPSSAVASAQDTMVSALVDGGVWGDLDLLYVPDNAGRLQNWISPGTYDCSEVANGGSLTYTEGLGVESDGSAYLNTGFNPGNHATKMQLTSGCTFGYMNTDQNDGFMLGSEYAATYLALAARAFGSAVSRINSASDGNVASNANAIGFYYSDQVNWLTTLYKDNIQIDQDTAGSRVAMTVNPVFICCSNDDNTAEDFTQGQISIIGLGAALSSVQRTVLYNAVNTYMTTVNAL